MWVVILLLTHSFQAVADDNCKTVTIETCPDDPNSISKAKYGDIWVLDENQHPGIPVPQKCLQNIGETCQLRPCYDEFHINTQSTSAWKFRASVENFVLVDCETLQVPPPKSPINEIERPWPKPSCDSHICHNGFSKKPGAAQIRCQDAKCAHKECCNSNPTCATHTCSRGSQPRRFPEKVICGTAKCRNAECCFNYPTCATFVCARDYFRRSNPTKIICRGVSGTVSSSSGMPIQCIETDCCIKKPTCESYACTTGTHPRPEPLTIQCASSRCTNNECCLKTPSCNSYKCPKNLEKPDANLIFCKHTGCSFTECCNPSPILTPSTTLKEKNEILKQCLKCVATVGNSFGFQSEGCVPQYNLIVHNGNACVRWSILDAVRNRLPSYFTSKEHASKCCALVIESSSNAISGSAFEDNNSNGIQDGDELGLPNIDITLYKDINRNGKVDNGEPLAAETRTDKDGNYVFFDVPIDYVVVAKVPPGFDAITSGGIHDNTVNFAYSRRPGGSVSLQVWEDIDGDGVQDNNEHGLAGVAVMLYINGNFDGILDKNDPFVMRTHTNSSGHIIFDNLSEGKYFVYSELPPGYERTTHHSVRPIVILPKKVSTAIFGYRKLQCSDYPGWVDSEDDGCDYYAQDNNCDDDGNHYANMGFTAKEACCVCGGGSPGNALDECKTCLQNPGHAYGFHGEGCVRVPTKDLVQGTRACVRWTLEQTQKNQMPKEYSSLDVATKCCDYIAGICKADTRISFPPSGAVLSGSICSEHSDCGSSSEICHWSYLSGTGCCAKPLHISHIGSHHTRYPSLPNKGKHPALPIFPSGSYFPPVQPGSLHPSHPHPSHVHSSIPHPSHPHPTHPDSSHKFVTVGPAFNPLHVPDIPDSSHLSYPHIHFDPILNSPVYHLPNRIPTIPDPKLSPNPIDKYPKDQVPSDDSDSVVLIMGPHGTIEWSAGTEPELNLFLTPNAGHFEPTGDNLPSLGRVLGRVGTLLDDYYAPNNKKP